MSNPSHVSATPTSASWRIPSSHPFFHAWKASLVFGVVGGVAAWVGFNSNPGRFAFSYLFAFLCFLFVGLGAIFYVLVLHLTSAGWAVTTRRTAEFFASGMPVLALLFLPIVAVMQNLYPWYQHEAPQHELASHSAPQANAHATGGHSGAAHAVPEGHSAKANDDHHGPAHVAHEMVVKKKHAYLNKPFFLLRMLLYFCVWLFLSYRLVSLSVQQDESRNLGNTVKLKRMAAPGIILLGLTLTFAAFDWIMSLEPAWYSTIFGVYLFASSAVAIFSVVIVTTLLLRSRGFFGDSINVEHYHDLGKLLFGFIVFWAYIAFSQLLLIWYAGIPEEATFYHLRWDGGVWQRVSLFLLFGHFFFPFALILSRNIKRRLAILGFAASWMLLLHVVEMYWFVMPYYHAEQFHFHWLDVACLLFVGGMYKAVVLRKMAHNSLVPVGDPRLERSLHFENV